ncbi:MAG: Gfo/Idh/MocA family oxidoreductase [Chitinophagaceae bacterium]|nr:Gfo/Idh/MocA family oxidoreductase [Chitinophagaceae bacterium]
MLLPLPRRKFLQTTALAGLGLAASSFTNAFRQKNIRIGIIGLDTSHCEAFTKVINASDKTPEFQGFEVVAAYPYGSKTIESSASRIPKITEDIQKYNVKITSSIAELLQACDVVLLETNDGRLHLEQATEVIKAGKPVFIDKPIAASLKDASAIFATAKKHNVPVFSCSSLRFTPAVQDIAKGKTVGKVLGADVFTPCSIEKTHPDLFWYGIHGVETLFTILGKNCKQVTRTHTEETDIVTGVWEDGRIGTFRGTRNGEHDYGGTAFGEKGNNQFSAYGGYEPLLVEIVKFFKTGTPPVEANETIAICAFMEAADESKRLGGKPVEIASILKKNKVTLL